MEERAGCGIGAGVLFLVTALFLAGYLFAADNLEASRAAEAAKAAEAIRVANEARLDAEAKLAAVETALARLEAENAALRAAAEQMAGQPGMIPVVGGSKVTPINEILLWGLGAGVSGLVIVLITQAARRSPSEQRRVRADDGSVMVKMSREEARAYARGRRRG